MKLQNPVASLISAPFQNNWNFGISATSLQPFLSYTTKAYTTYAVNTESTYDWQNSQWIVPVNATVSQLLNFWKATRESNPCNSRSADAIIRRSPMAEPIGDCASL